MRQTIYYTILHNLIESQVYKSMAITQCNTTIYYNLVISLLKFVQRVSARSTSINLILKT